MCPDWERRIDDEDRSIERASPELHADPVVAGAPTIDHDPDREVIVLRCRLAT